MGRGVGHVCTHMSTLGVPWEEIAVDTIGLWKIVILNYDPVTFNGFTIIDTTTGLFEIQRVTQRNLSGLEIVDALNLISLGIKSIPTSVANPQANLVLRRSYDTIKTAMGT